MHVLVLGASGLIGGATMQRLVAAGHTVRAVCRRVPVQSQAGITWIAADTGKLTHPDDWQALVDSIDVVINAVGVFRDTSLQPPCSRHVWRSPIAA
jgi:uncharacterized protein YbjT (DUF2867 family)